VLFDASLFVLAPLAVILALFPSTPSRREIRFALIWVVVYYFALSYVFARDTRYALPLTPPLIILSVAGLLALLRQVAARLGGHPSRYFLVALTAVLVINVWKVPFVTVPRAAGFQEVVAFLEREAPNERVFYDGFHNGVFSFYVRARDPHFSRGVVVGSKLLYDAARFHQGELTSSVSDVIEHLRTKCGCRWIAIEQWSGSERIPAATYLREALAGGEFQFVASFPIRSQLATRVDVYRFLPPTQTPEKLEFRLPILGDGTVYRVKPLER
jgi:hypothetical protein